MISDTSTSGFYSELIIRSGVNAFVVICNVLHTKKMIQIIL